MGEETLSRHGQARSASRHAMRRSEVQAVARHSRRSGGAATSQGEGERAGKRAGERLLAQLSSRERMTAHFSLARARNERTSCQRPNPSAYSPACIACEIAPSATPTTASIEWPRAAQCAQPHAKKAPPTSSSARRRLRDAILSGAGSRLVCGGARSTLGRALRRGGGRWGSPARRPRLSQPERSERGRELAALLGQSGTLALAGVQGLLLMAAGHVARFRRIRFRLDRRFRYERSDPRRSSAAPQLLLMIFLLFFLVRAHCIAALDGHHAEGMRARSHPMVECSATVAHGNW